MMGVDIMTMNIERERGDVMEYLMIVDHVNNTTSVRSKRPAPGTVTGVSDWTALCK